MSPLMSYYASMIIYMVAAVPLILYGLVIKPIANLYNEPVSTMVSPVFGNYANYLNGLFTISAVLVTLSLAFFIFSWYGISRAGKSFSVATKALPVILFAFAYILLGVSGLA